VKPLESWPRASRSPNGAAVPFPPGILAWQELVSKCCRGMPVLSSRWDFYGFHAHRPGVSPLAIDGRPVGAEKALPKNQKLAGQLAAQTFCDRGMNLDPLATR